MTLRLTPERTMKSSQATFPAVSLVTDNAKLRVRPIRGLRPTLGCTLVPQSSHAVPAVIRAVRFIGRSSGGARTRVGSGPPVGLHEQGGGE